VRSDQEEVPAVPVPDKRRVQGRCTGRSKDCFTFTDRGSEGDWHFARVGLFFHCIGPPFHLPDVGTSIQGSRDPKLRIYCSHTTLQFTVYRK